MDNSYITLGLAALLPVFMSAVFFLLDKKTRFGKLSYAVKQTIYGIFFGALAVVGTEWGIHINGAVVNCRDAAVISAGLLFGSPAGIIAGLIGGIERWFSVYWGVGSFTRVACSISTIFAGLLSAVLRRYMFENKRPGWLLAFAIGVVIEVFHLTMVFITNITTPVEALEVVIACTAPMVSANGVSVLLSTIAFSLLGKEKMQVKHSSVKISQTIQRWLLLAVTFAFVTTSLFIASLQTSVAKRQAYRTLELAIDETSRDISDLTASGKLYEIGISNISHNRYVGESGWIVILDSDMNIMGGSANFPEALFRAYFNPDQIRNSNEMFTVQTDEENYYCRTKQTEGFYVVTSLPETEVNRTRTVVLYVNTFMEILIFAILFGLIYLLIKKIVVNRMKKVNASLAKITNGDLDVVVNVRSNEEFASLSDDINSTVNTLKKYIEEASARIDKELEFAKNIQASALPNIFPAYPKHKDFDIFASMDAAKEVGGDFYDFYMTDDNTLHFLIADVSGKGIPAAMFMMRAKTELKSLTETGIALSEVFTNGNSALCEGNDMGMFVTAWQGTLDLKTGSICFANAGHNPPLVRHADGKFEYLKSRTGFVLAGMEGIKYKSQELKLSEGDTIYLYTDGVTEATNAENELYGEERLLEAINSCEFGSMQELCRFVRADVDKFVGDAPQFDDITMVALKYIGTPPIPSITFENASIEDIPAVTEFVESELEKAGCPMKTIIKMNVAIDEIYSNIVKYGYAGTTGPATVYVLIKDDPKAVYVRFVDEGVPYNPLTKEDPDVTLSAEERQIGGLGIYMVKKTMDDIKYKYEDEKNIFTIKKFF